MVAESKNVSPSKNMPAASPGVLPQTTAAPKAGAGAKPDSSIGSSARRAVSVDERRVMIAEAAYYIAERRGFEVGHEIEDWLLAENQVDSAFAARGSPAQQA